MSETITKACETCAGVCRPMTYWNGTVDCVDCSGTGRVTDVEATLRAEVARLTLREPTQAEGDAAEGTPDEAGNVWPAGSCFLGRTGRRCLDCNRWTWGGPTRCEQCAERAGVDRLTAEANAATTQARIVRLTLASVLGRGHEERDVVELAADVVQVVAESRGEVERLKSEVASLDLLARGERAMVDTANDVIDTANDVIADLRAKISECAALGLEALRRLGERDAEVARLTAEVEQLKTATEAQSRGRRVQAAHEREVAALYGTIDAARAEVARLTAREREAARILSFVSTSHASAWSAEAEAWLARCKS